MKYAEISPVQCDKSNVFMNVTYNKLLSNKNVYYIMQFEGIRAKGYNMRGSCGTHFVSCISVFCVSS